MYSNQRPIFIGGAGRSGTTLLRVILDSHPNIACGPELKTIAAVCDLWYSCQTLFLPFLKENHLEVGDINRIFARMIQSLLDKNRRLAGKQRSAEKTPVNLYYFNHLHCIFPESPLIHMIRDGRDVVCSLLTMDWFHPKTGKREPYTVSPAKAAQYWVDAIEVGRTHADNQELSGRYRELRYEDLVSDPEPTLHALFEFLDEPWNPVVLSYYEKTRNLASESSAEQVSKPLYTSAVGRWKQDLTGKAKRAVKEVAGDLLIELGYAEGKDW